MIAVLNYINKKKTLIKNIDMNPFKIILLLWLLQFSCGTSPSFEFRSPLRQQSPLSNLDACGDQKEIRES